MPGTGLVALQTRVMAIVEDRLFAERRMEAGNNKASQLRS